MFAGVAEGLFDDVKDDGRLVCVDPFAGIADVVDRDLRVVPLPHLFDQHLECLHQALRLEGERTQCEEHIADLGDRLPRKLLNHLQFVFDLVRFLVDHLARKVDPHGDSREALRRPIV